MTVAADGRVPAPAGKHGSDDEDLDDQKPQGWLGLAACVMAAVGAFGVFSVVSHARRHGDSPSGAKLIQRKPKSDSREYQFSWLRNGIQVVSIHDPTALSDAYSMAVDAGSFDDPVEFPGLAHFCEHMLFLGTEGYPDPTSYDDFVNRNGGYMNAYTAEQTTVYYAELAQGSLDEALDRFGDFFRAPRFNDSLVGKEIHAIDSEHAKNVQDPTWRLFALFNALANPESPVSRFHTGDLETLYTAPRKAGSDPVVALKSWFDAHYCPSRMHLVTFGSTPLAEQLEKAEKYLGNISSKAPSCDREAPRSWSEPAPWPEERLGQWVSVRGTTPDASIVLFFALPDLTREYRSQPMAYVEYALTYGGEGSLLTVLRDDLGLVSQVSVSSSTNSAGGVLMVEFGLSEEGKTKQDSVLDVFFQYVGTLRNTQVEEELYNSIAAVRKLSWDWSEKSDAADTASTVAERLTRLPADGVLSGDALVEYPDPALVTSLLKQLSPERMNAALLDANVTFADPGGVRKLPHYGVEYAAGALAARFPESLPRWRRWLEPHGARESAAELREALASPELRVPRPPHPIDGVPRYVSTGYMRAGKAKAEPGRFDADIVGPRPSLLKAASLLEANGTSARAWYRRGWVTASPKVQIKAAFRLPKTEAEWESPALDRLRVDLYASLFKRRLGPKTYDQTVAGASYDVSLSTDGIVLSFEGFQPLLPRLISRVMDEFRSGLEVTQVELDRATRELSDSLQSYSEMPVTYAISDRSVLLTTGGHSKAEALASLSGINVSSVSSAMSDLLLRSPMQFDSLVMGNLNDAQAAHATSALKKGVATGRATRSAGQVLPATPVVRPGRPVELRKKNPRAGDPNGVVVVTLLHGVGSVRDKVVFGLLGQILGQLAYNELRTKQQLGYVVHAGEVLISNVQAVSTVVQGATADADAMEAAVDRLYFEDMGAHLDNLTEDDFQSFRRSYRQQLMHPPLGHGEEFGHFWSPILTNITCNGLRNEMLWFLDEALTGKQLLVDTWSGLVRPGGARQKVVIKYFPDRVPERPSREASDAAWRERGISDADRRQLADEFGATVVLSEADSRARARLVALGGHFPAYVDCALPEAERPARRPSATPAPEPAAEAVADPAAAPAAAAGGEASAPVALAAEGRGRRRSHGGAFLGAS